MLAQFRLALACSALCLAVFPFAPALAQDQATYHFDLPEQSLAQALRAIARQTGANILFESKDLNGIKAHALRERLTLAEAVEKVLVGTKLQAERTTPTTIIVQSAKQRSAAGDDSADARFAAGNGARQWRIAQADTTTEAASPDQAASESAAETSLAGIQRPAEIDRIVVTGSRLRGPEDEGPAPVFVFDRDYINQLGAATVSDVLEYLPQQPFSSDEGFQFGGSRVIRLRGLGTGTTLILINGRRTVTSALTVSSNYFDMNSIPLVAVERVEVLSDSASAVYGTDAVGGVVNVILKKGITEPTLDLYYGAADGGADERRASLSYGHTTARFSGSLVLDWFDRDFLFGTQREYYSDRDFRRFGGADRRVATSNPGNVCSADGSTLTGLTTPCAAVPEGSTGVGLTPADFASTAGLTNMQTTSIYSDVIPAAERSSAFATAEFAATDWLGAFAEFFYTQREESRSAAPLTLNNTLVPATNPFNPFGEAVRVRYLLEALGPQRQLADSDAWRAVAGLTGRLGTWDWEVSALGTDDEATNTRNYLLDMARITASLNSTDPAQSLNVFQDGPGGSPELLAQLITADLAPVQFKSRAIQGSAFVRGGVLDLPGGSLEAVFGVETRDEEIHINSGGIIVTADRRSSSGFAEFRIPLVGEAMGVSAVRDLVLTLAGRYDEYDDFGSTVNPQYGVEWRPVSPLLVRASYGTSFRAPTLIELHQPPFAFPGGSYPDPARGEQASGVTTLTGGNDQLEPEESDSLTVGFVLTPLAGLRIQASYWRIEQDQRVQRLQPQTMIANEASFPDRIIRDPPTPEDIAAGRPGVLRAVNVQAMNFGALKTDGVDFEISSAFETAAGRFTPSVAVTWIDDFVASDLPNAPALDRVGIASVVQGSIVEWKGRATLGWQYRGLGVAAHARYISSYDDANTLGFANGRRLPSQVLVDLQMAMDMGQQLNVQSGWSDGLVLRAGVSNLFDDGPAFSESGGLGYDTFQSDIRQRFGYLSVSKSF